MGELGFGRSFGTLQEARTSHVVHLVERGVRAINTIGNVPYVAHILRFLPSPIAAFEAWLTTALDWRLQKDRKKDDGLVPTDVFAYLLGEEGKQRRKLNRKELQQDCMLVRSRRTVAWRPVLISLRRWSSPDRTRRRTP
jgi:hypothetical protein